MKDIFDYEIICEKCNKKMQNSLVRREGFNLRVKKCPSCENLIIHPEDKTEYENFIKLKKKEYEVKMRMVGNSYAVSIPREIVDFMKEQENMINNMVRLSFQDVGRLSLMFNTSNGENYKRENSNSRVVKSREVKILRNNNSILHARQFIDSANPERSKTEIFKGSRKMKKEGGK